MELLEEGVDGGDRPILSLLSAQPRLSASCGPLPGSGSWLGLA
jgi:hypothetical protein